MRLDADGDAEPGGQRHGLLEDPRRGPEPVLARRGRVERAAEHPHQRGLPVAGQLEEPAQRRDRDLSPVRRIELSTATTGSPAAVRVRPTCARRAAGMAGSMSSPSMSRSSIPE